MKSLILATATRFLMPMILLFAVFLLLRGHNLPGGGFIGGLIASAAFGLYLLAFGVEETRRLARIDPRSLVGLGLLVVIGSGLAGYFDGDPFLTARWVEIFEPAPFKLGTPLLFDIGIFLVVLGAVLAMMIALGEE
ncbi:MAG: Na+/H+ antiporter subunit B [Syntrophotaleaceae bacterium]